MKRKIINFLIWIAIIGIVIFWTWFLEWMAPGTPFQAFFVSLTMLTPNSVLLILAIAKIVVNLEHGEPIWAWQEPKPRKLPLWYRILSKIFR